MDDGEFLGVSVGGGDLGGARGDINETVVGAVVFSGVGDGRAVVDDGDHVDGEGEGEVGDDGVDDLFEGGGKWCLVRCGIGGHGESDYYAAAFGSGLVVVDSPLGCATGLNAEILCLGKALFLEGGSDDAAAGVKVGRVGWCGAWGEDVRLGEDGVFVINDVIVGGGGGCGEVMARGD